MDEINDFLPAPTQTRPLLGLTILVVEDSRFACEAMRLLCLRSGARIRRADCLRSARRHLQVYRPSAVIVDLGLPDGSGAELIAELCDAAPRIEAILGISGDEASETVALEAGADGFLLKPVSSISAFQAAILKHLPADRRPAGPRVVDLDQVEPDAMAYQDDIAHMAELLGASTDAATLDYVAQFLHGVARSADDKPLLDAVERLGSKRAAGQPSISEAATVAGLIHARLAQPIAI